MATAKRLIESQDGQIAVDCPPTGGTVVTLTHSGRAGSWLIAYDGLCRSNFSMR